MKYLLALMLALAFTGEAQGKIVTKNVEYRQDGTLLEGYLAYDDVARLHQPRRGPRQIPGCGLQCQGRSPLLETHATFLPGNFRPGPLTLPRHFCSKVI